MMMIDNFLKAVWVSI